MKKILKWIIFKVARVFHADIYKKFDELETGIQGRYIQSMYAFFLNEKISQTTDWEINYKYQYYKKIRNLTSIETPVNFKCDWDRIGRENDGGYLMLILQNTAKVAYSFGVCDDTSWDHDMANLGYEIYLYDHTIEALPESNERFHWKKIGITGNDETAQLKKLSTLMKENGHDSTQHMILKIDIEGAEWDVFANMPDDVLKQFDEIVVEWHNLLDNKNRHTIEKALTNLHANYACVHVHANNFGKVDFCGDIVMPDTIEVTYLNRNVCETKEQRVVLPRELDMPCCGSAPEICLGNW